MAVKGERSGLDRTQNSSPGGASNARGGPGGSLAAAKVNAAQAFGGPVSANPNNPRTQNITRSASNFTGPGATPFVADPSIGQVAGALTSLVPGAGTMNNLGGAAMGLLHGGNFGDTYNGGMLGSAIDHMLGGTPGPITGANNPDANSAMRATPGGFGAMVNPLRPVAPTIPPPMPLQLSALAQRPPLGASMMRAA